MSRSRKSRQGSSWQSYFFRIWSLTYFTEASTDLRQEAIGTQGFRLLLESSPYQNFFRKSIATCDFPGGGNGVLTPCLWIHPWYWSFNNCMLGNFACFFVFCRLFKIIKKSSECQTVWIHIYLTWSVSKLDIKLMFKVKYVYNYGNFYTPVLKKQSYYSFCAVCPSVCLSIHKHSCTLQNSITIDCS